MIDRFVSYNWGNIVRDLHIIRGSNHRNQYCQAFYIIIWKTTYCRSVCNPLGCLWGGYGCCLFLLIVCNSFLSCCHCTGTKWFFTLKNQENIVLDMFVHFLWQSCFLPVFRLSQSTCNWNKIKRYHRRCTLPARLKAFPSIYTMTWN